MRGMLRVSPLSTFTIRIYARENATQRNNGTSQTGTVASAIRFLAKAIMVNSPALSEFLTRACHHEGKREFCRHIS